MRKIFRLLTAVLILVLFTAPAFSALRFKTHTKYTLYIGMNDGKTGKPVYNLLDARRILVNIAGKYVDGYTVYDAESGIIEDSCGGFLRVSSWPEFIADVADYAGCGFAKDAYYGEID